MDFIWVLSSFFEHYIQSSVQASPCIMFFLRALHSKSSFIIWTVLCCVCSSFFDHYEYTQSSVSTLCFYALFQFYLISTGEWTLGVIYEAMLSLLPFFDQYTQVQSSPGVCRCVVGGIVWACVCGCGIVWAWAWACGCGIPWACGCGCGLVWPWACIYGWVCGVRCAQNHVTCTK